MEKQIKMVSGLQIRCIFYIYNAYFFTNSNIWLLVRIVSMKQLQLTLSLLLTTIMPNANSLDLDEMLSNLASHPDPSCLTLRKHFHKLWTTLKHFEKTSRQEIKQTTIYLAG